MREIEPPPLSLWLRELPHLAQIWLGPMRRARSIATKASSNLRPPVMVIPGIMSSDYATAFLRKTLIANGYPTYPAQLGFVTGVTPEVFERAQRQLARIQTRHGRKVVLIGWSLGGLYSRVLAQRHPDQVEMVMTMGSPFSGSRKANNAWRVYNALNDHTVDDPPLPDDPSIKPPMHTVALWSRDDGVIAPECARGLSHERDVEIELATRHFKFGSDRATIDAVAQILSQQLKQCDL